MHTSESSEPHPLHPCLNNKILVQPLGRKYGATFDLVKNGPPYTFDHITKLCSPTYRRSLVGHVLLVITLSVVWL